MIADEHFAKAATLAPESNEQRSPEYREGFNYVVAWALAGRPAPTPERNAADANRHPKGSAQRDAWLFGWGNGFAFAKRAGLIPETVGNEP